MTYEQGVQDERARVITLLDEYEITELLGGAIMLTPKCEKPMPLTEHTLGSLSGYFKNGCRCDACKSVAKRWQDERFASLDDAEKRKRRDRKTNLQRHRRSLKKGEIK